MGKTRIVSITLTLILLFTIFSSTVHSEQAASVNPSQLTGIDGHYAGEAALTLFNMGVFYGDENGNARLDDPLNRIEFAALLVRIFYTDTKILPGEPFLDIPADGWEYLPAMIAKQEGITVGDGAGNFLPRDYLTREQVALMLTRLTKAETAGYTLNFTDIPDDYPYYGAIAYCVGNHIMRGINADEFMPTLPCSRGDAVIALARVITLLNIKPKTSFNESNETTNDNSNPVLNTPGASYNIDEAKNKGGVNVNITWHQMYRPNVPYPDYDMQGIDVISPTWFTLVDDSTKDENAVAIPLDGGLGFYLQSYGNPVYVKEAEKRGVKVWPLFRRDERLSRERISEFMNSPETRKSAAEQLVYLAEDFGFTGVNLDFEYMFQDDKYAYSDFVREVRDAGKQYGLTTSVDVTRYDPTSASYSLAFDRKSLAEAADYVILMAYDEYTPQQKIPGPTASIPWTEESIKLTLKEVPPEQLILGIPFYSRLWEVNDAGEFIKGTTKGLDSMQQLLIDNGITPVYDSETGLDYAQWQKDGVTYKIWLEDLQSIAKRLDFVEKYGLQGVASWSNVFAADSPEVWEYIDERLN